MEQLWTCMIQNSDVHDMWLQDHILPSISQGEESFSETISLFVFCSQVHPALFRMISCLPLIESWSTVMFPVHWRHSACSSQHTSYATYSTQRKQLQQWSSFSGMSFLILTFTRPFLTRTSNPGAAPDWPRGGPWANTWFSTPEFNPVPILTCCSCSSPRGELTLWLFILRFPIWRMSLAPGLGFQPWSKAGVNSPRRFSNLGGDSGVARGWLRGENFKWETRLIFTPASPRGHHPRDLVSWEKTLCHTFTWQQYGLRWYKDDICRRAIFSV